VNPKPNFTSTLAALRCTDPRFPWVHPTPEEAEVADLIEEMEALHVGPADTPDEHGYYGRCTGCLEPWPCTGWSHMEYLAVQWLGRGQDRYWAHAKAVMDEQDQRRGTAA
jgi:hypothetical protein